MNSASRLGFAIPAYRRPDTLDVALQSLVAQAAPLAAPIYIPDDSCDSTNVATVTKWRRSYGNIIHEINRENLGIDRNIDKAISQCPAEYVHVMGDDDVLLPQFAAHAASIIAASAPGHILCSYMYLTNDYRPISGKAVIPDVGGSPTLRQFLPRYGWALGFIGAHIFCRARFRECRADGFGTYFNHLVKLVTYLDPDEPLGFIAAPCIGNRADDESTATWSGSRLDVVFGIESAFSQAMRGSYPAAEVGATVARARRNLGHAQYFRLLHWAAIAERSGQRDRYWPALQRHVSPSKYLALRAVPRVFYAGLIAAIPSVRRTKRRLRRLLGGRA